jgi:hypothetical protein
MHQNLKMTSTKWQQLNRVKSGEVSAFTSETKKIAKAFEENKVEIDRFQMEQFEIAEVSNSNGSSQMPEISSLGNVSAA